MVLGMINRRRNPLVVPGTWDFVGVLFAASGFLLFGGPYILEKFFEYWRTSLLLGPQRFPGLAGASGFIGMVLYVLYFAAIAGIAVYVLGLRRRLTVIYNVDPAVFDEASGQVLDALGYSWERTGNQVVIRAPGKSRPATLDYS